RHSGGEQPLSTQVMHTELHQFMKRLFVDHHSLTEFALEEGPDEVDETYSNVVGQDSLTRFDEQRRRRKKRSGRRNRPGNKPKSGGDESKASGNNEPQGGKADGNKPGKSRKKRRRPPRNANAKTDKS
ncbi:MAG: hypothetical protein ACPF84_04385, partial [Flavobacteriales bacterium]